MRAALHAHTLLTLTVSGSCHEHCAVGCNCSELHTVMSAWLLSPQAAIQWHREEDQGKLHMLRGSSLHERPRITGGQRQSAPFSNVKLNTTGCQLTPIWRREEGLSGPGYAAICLAHRPTQAELYPCMTLLSKAPMWTECAQRPGSV